MGCRPLCRYIPPLLPEWPPTENEEIMWETVATGICPPPQLVDPTPEELNTHKLLQLICSGATAEEIGGWRCGNDFITDRSIAREKVALAGEEGQPSPNNQCPHFKLTEIPPGQTGFTSATAPIELLLGAGSDPGAVIVTVYGGTPPLIL